ncbi:hypothetical protein AB0D14_27100 [Streptomyces sp. NPDC048484]|uniref:hypothetical protein n=1 Tax=Streptomyces sp. NPDC048484 TaxID=3155146 RepID=UPI00343C7FB5
MPDNSAAGPSRDQRSERDDTTRTPGTPGTRTPGTSGARGTGSDTVREGVAGREGAGTRAPEGGAARTGTGSGTGTGIGTSPGTGTGTGTHDDVLGGRDTAAQERAREGRDTVVGGERIPAGPGAAEHDRSPAREGITGPTGTGGRSSASREGIRGAEARVNAGADAGTGGRLMPHDEGDKWSLRLQHAVTAFVDGPKGSVEEADQVLQEVAERFADAVTQRRRALRTSWQATGEDKADTEQLRLALKDYRELAERLLRI